MLRRQGFLDDVMLPGHMTGPLPVDTLKLYGTVITTCNLSHVSYGSF
jgi:hypothetical protein